MNKMNWTRLALVAALTFCFLLPAKAQEIACEELLLIRSAHYYPESCDDELTKAREAIKNFAPDIFITEYLDGQDSIGLAAFESNALIFYTRFVEAKDAPPSLKDSEGEGLIEKLKEIKLLAEAKDQSNYEYQGHLFMKRLEAAPEQTRSQVIQLMEQHFTPLDTLRKYIRYDRRNEYQLIAFPTASALGMEKLYSMDDQRDSAAFHENWQACADGYENEAAQVFSMTIDSLEKSSQESGTFLQGLNHPSIDLIDHYVYAIPMHFSENAEAAKAYAHYWDLRNQHMVENTMRILQESKAKKAALIVGASHGRLMEKYLREKGVNVLRLYQEQETEEETGLDRMADKIEKLINP